MIFSWFDIVIVAFLAWGYFSGKKSDFVTEIFKLIGAFFTTFIALHYFHLLGIFFGSFLFLPERFRDGFALVVLGVLIYVLFFYMAKGWFAILKVKCPLFLDKWGSIVISLLKSFILSGLVYLMFVMLLQGPFARAAKDSFSAKFLSVTSAEIYKKMFVYLVHPVFRSEEFNRHVLYYVPKNKFNLP